MATGLEDIQILFNETLNGATQTIEAAERAKAAAITSIGNKSLEQISVIDKAMENLERAESLPDGIANLLGFFDSDFNKDKQLVTIQRAQNAMRALGIQAEQAENAANMQIQSAARQVDNLYKRFQMQDTVLGRNIQLQNLALSQEQMAMARADQQYQNLQRQIYALGDDELNNIVNEGKIENLGLYQEEQRRRQDLEYRLRAARAAAAAGDKELQDASAAHVMEQLTSDDLQGFLEKMNAENKGVITPFKDVPIALTRDQVMAALTEKLKLEEENARQRMESDAAVAAAEASVTRAGVMLDGLRNINNGVLPPTLEAGLAAFQTRVQAAAQTGNPRVYSEAVNEVSKYVDEQIDEYLKNTMSNEEQRAAARHALENHGFQNRSMASQYLTGVPAITGTIDVQGADAFIRNIHELSGNQLDSAGKPLGEEVDLATILGSMAAKNKITREQAMEQAMTRVDPITGARPVDLYVSDLRDRFFVDSVFNIARANPQFMKDFVTFDASNNPVGINGKYYTENAAGETLFKREEFLKDMLVQNQALARSLFTHMSDPNTRRDFISRTQQQYFGDLAAAAFVKLAEPANLDYQLRALSETLQANMPRIEQVIQEQQAQTLTQDIARFIQAAENQGSTLIDPNQRSMMLQRMNEVRANMGLPPLTR